MNLLCPNCQKTLTVPEQFAGQTMKCPLCNGNFTVPSLPAPTEPASPPPPPVSAPAAPAGEAQPAFLASPPPGPPAAPALEHAAEPAFKITPPPAASPPVSEPPATTAAARSADATTAQPTRHRTLVIRGRVLRWVPPLALLVIFFLQFFPWFGIYPGGVPAVTQNAWGAAFNLTPSSDPDMNAVFTLPADVEKNTTISPLVLFYLFPTFLLALVVALFIVVEPFLHTQLPPQVQQLVPWKWAILAGLNALLLLFLTLQLLLNFSLESTYRDYVAKKYEAKLAAGARTHELKQIEAERGQELQMLQRSCWLKLTFVLQLLSAAAAGLVYWVEKRGPDKPLPAIELRY